MAPSSPRGPRTPAPPAFRLRIESLEDRTDPSTFIEVEPNNSFADANLVTVPTGDILTTPATDWLTIQGARSTAKDNDYYTFTLTQRAGVFFDIDSPVHTLTSGLQTVLTLYNSSQTQIDTNTSGYDFDEFNVPETPTLGPFIPPQPTGVHFDSSLYRDLQPGTYFIRVTPGTNITGNYNLRILADTTYTASPPVFNSLPGATDTLYLDYDGHSATDSWGTYTATPYDFGNTPGEWSPGERLAIRNAWQVMAEDFAPFNINITTATAPATMVAGESLRMIVTNSTGSIINRPGPAGIAWLDVYGDDLNQWRNAFVFAGAMPNSLFGRPACRATSWPRPIEIGATAAHEFGHNLGLEHYQAQASEGSGTVLPRAIMAWSNQGIDKTRWAKGMTYFQGGAPSVFQDDMERHLPDLQHLRLPGRRPRLNDRDRDRPDGGREHVHRDRHHRTGAGRRLVPDHRVRVHDRHARRERVLRQPGRDPPAPRRGRDRGRRGQPVASARGPRLPRPWPPAPTTWR